MVNEYTGEVAPKNGGAAPGASEPGAPYQGAGQNNIIGYTSNGVPIHATDTYEWGGTQEYWKAQEQKQTQQQNAQQNSQNQQAQQQAQNANPYNPLLQPAKYNQYQTEHPDATYMSSAEAQAEQSALDPPFVPDLSSAAGIAAYQAHMGGFLTESLAKKARAEGYTGVIYSEGNLPSGMETVPIPDYSSQAGSPMSIPTYGNYVPGMVTMMALGKGNVLMVQDSKMLASKTTGEFGIYQPRYDPYTGAMSTRLYLVGGGSRYSLQSGKFSYSLKSGQAAIADAMVPPEHVYNQWDAGKVVPLSQEYMDTHSGLGAEAYGGFGGIPVDNRLLTPDSKMSVYSNKLNLANLVNPATANTPKAQAPGAKIPWEISAGSPNIQWVDKFGAITPLSSTDLANIGITPEMNRQGTQIFSMQMSSMPGPGPVPKPLPTQGIGGQQIGETGLFVTLNPPGTGIPVYDTGDRLPAVPGTFILETSFKPAERTPQNLLLYLGTQFASLQTGIPFTKLVGNKMFDETTYKTQYQIELPPPFIADEQARKSFAASRLTRDEYAGISLAYTQASAGYKANATELSALSGTYSAWGKSLDATAKANTAGGFWTRDQASLDKFNKEVASYNTYGQKVITPKTNALDLEYRQLSAMETTLNTKAPILFTMSGEYTVKEPSIKESWNTQLSKMIPAYGVEAKPYVSKDTSFAGQLLTHASAFQFGAYDTFQKQPVDVIQNVALGVAFSGAFELAGMGGAAILPKIASVAPRTATVLSYGGKAVPYLMVGGYGFSVAERSTYGFSDFSPKSTERFGGIASTEIVPLMIGGYAYSRASTAYKRAQLEAEYTTTNPNPEWWENAENNLAPQQTGPKPGSEPRYIGDYTSEGWKNVPEPSWQTPKPEWQPASSSNLPVPRNVPEAWIDAQPSKPTPFSDIVKMSQSEWQDFVVNNPSKVQPFNLYNVAVARGQARIDFMTGSELGSSLIWGSGADYYNPAEYEFIKSGLLYPKTVEYLTTGASKVTKFGGYGDYWTKIDVLGTGKTHTGNKAYITFNSLTQFVPETAEQFISGLKSQGFEGSFKVPTSSSDAAGRFEHLVLYESTPGELNKAIDIAKNIWGESNIEIGFGTDIAGMSSTEMKVQQMRQQINLGKADMPEWAKQFPPVPKGYTRIAHVTRLVDIENPEFSVDINSIQEKGLRVQPAENFMTNLNSGVEFASVDLTGQGVLFASAPGATPETWYKAVENTYVKGLAGTRKYPTDPTQHLFTFDKFEGYGDDILIFDVKPEIYKEFSSEYTGAGTYVGKITRSELRIQSQINARADMLPLEPVPNKPGLYPGIGNKYGLKMTEFFPANEPYPLEPDIPATPRLKTGYSTSQIQQLFIMKNAPVDYGVSKSYRVPDPTEFMYQRVPMAGTEITAGYPIIRDFVPKTSVQKMVESGHPIFDMFKAEPVYGVENSFTLVMQQKGLYMQKIPGTNIFRLKPEHSLPTAKKIGGAKEGKRFFSDTAEKVPGSIGRKYYSDPNKPGVRLSYETGGSSGRLLGMGQTTKLSDETWGITGGGGGIFRVGSIFTKMEGMSYSHLSPYYNRKFRLIEDEGEMIYAGEIPGVSRPVNPVSEQHLAVLIDQHKLAHKKTELSLTPARTFKIDTLTRNAEQQALMQNPVAKTIQQSQRTIQAQKPVVITNAMQRTIADQKLMLGTIPASITDQITKTDLRQDLRTTQEIVPIQIPRYDQIQRPIRDQIIKQDYPQITRPWEYRPANPVTPGIPGGLPFWYPSGGSGSGGGGRPPGEMSWTSRNPVGATLLGISRGSMPAPMRPGRKMKLPKFRMPKF